MDLSQTQQSLRQLFSELVEGAAPGGEAFILNSGDAGLLRSLDALDAGEASQAVRGGATVAAHAQHTRYGLSLMNRWATAGGNPFADARWDEAWKTTSVSEPQWNEIRRGLGDEARAWLQVLGTPREMLPIELTGMVSSVAHLAYHLGAIRQVSRGARGPKDGTFTAQPSGAAT